MTAQLNKYVVGVDYGWEPPHVVVIKHGVPERIPLRKGRFAWFGPEEDAKPMNWVNVFMGAMLALQMAASIAYLRQHNYKMSTYWFVATILVAILTFWRD